MKLPKLTTIFNIFAPIFFLVIIGFLIYYIIKRKKIQLIITTVILILFLGLIGFTRNKMDIQKTEEELAEKYEQVADIKGGVARGDEAHTAMSAWKKEEKIQYDIDKALLDDINNELQTKKLSLEEKRKLLRDRQALLKKLESQETGYYEELVDPNITEARRTFINQELRRLDEEITKLKQSISDLKEEIHNLTIDIEALAAKSAQLNAQVNARKKEIDDLTEIITKLEQKLAELRAAQAQIEKEIANLEVHLNTIKAQGMASAVLKGLNEFVSTIAPFKTMMYDLAVPVVNKISEKLGGDELLEKRNKKEILPPMTSKQARKYIQERINAVDIIYKEEYEKRKKIREERSTKIQTVEKNNLEAIDLWRDQMKKQYRLDNNFSSKTEQINRKYSQEIGLIQEKTELTINPPKRIHKRTNRP